MSGHVACGSAHDQVETAPGKDIRKMTLVVEPGDFAFTLQPLPGSPKRAGTPAQQFELLPQLPVESPHLAKEVLCPGALEAIGDVCGVTAFRGRQRPRQCLRFNCSKPADQPSLLRSTRRNQRSAQGHQLGGQPRALHRCLGSVIDGIEKSVPLSDEAVEVRQGTDLSGMLGGIIRDNCEPEAQLRQPHSSRRLIYSEKILPQYTSLSCR